MFKKFSIFSSIFCILLSFLFIPNNNSELKFPIHDNYYITSKFGYRQLYGVLNFHTGVDIAYTVGTKVYSASSGTVSYIGFDHDGYGNYIIISYNDYKFFYAHLNETHYVKVGDTVSTNTIISTIGPLYLSNGLKNGNTTGPHLHFEMRINNEYVDPLDYIEI